MEPKRAIVTLEYQPPFDLAVSPMEQRGQASSNDPSTIQSFEALWLSNAKKNRALCGTFGENSIGQQLGRFNNQPVIVAGSGPSLGRNIKKLKDRPPGVGLVSCLHNFHAMEDADARVDFYVSLDAQDVVLEEVTEGGSRPEEEYWALTKDRTLLAYIGSPPKLIERWQGPVLFFNAPIPKDSFMNALREIEVFNAWVSCGGNVLGAATYITQVFMGASPVVFVGADFSFSYDYKFHAWNSKYDVTLGNVMLATDVYGIRVKTWASYYGFKLWFEYVARQTGKHFINCTEGGILGSYPEGNIRQIELMDLEQFYAHYRIDKLVMEQSTMPEKPNQNLLY